MMKQNLEQWRQKDNPTATIGNFNIPLSRMKKTTSQNSNKKIENIITIDLTGIYGALHPPTGEGNGTPLQYSCLGNPMDGGAW